MFDIRNYKPTNTGVNNNNSGNNFIAQRTAFIKYVDEHFSLINQECASLNDNMNPASEEAFTKKLDAWRGFVGNLQILCQMYNIKDAQCLS